MASGTKPSRRSAEAAGGQVTIREVAERAGVSIATVSRVLSGSSAVNEQRRVRVERAAAELGYQRNELASNLRKQRVQLIGVVVPQIDDPLTAELLQHVEQTAVTAGYRVIVCTTGDVAAREGEHLRSLATQRVAGVVIRSCDPSSAEISRLLDLGISIVAVDTAVRDARADAVLIDNIEGVRRATQQLIAGGHTTIGFLGGSLDVESDGQRLRGYELAMREAGLPVVASVQSSRVGGGWLGTSKLLESTPGLTALIAGNASIALGMLDALRENGPRIPDELSILVIDDPFWMGIVTPPLSAYASPTAQIAASAVRLILRRLEDPTAQARRVVYELEARMRGSLG